MESDKTPDAMQAQFAAQSTTAEDLLKSQTVGLLHLADFRKRRAEALDQKDRDAQSRPLSRSGTPAVSVPGTPKDGGATSQPLKKRKKSTGKGKLSFGLENEDGGDDSSSRQATPDSLASDNRTSNSNTDTPPRRLGPNTSITNAPRLYTKSAMLKETQTREQLRKEFLAMQERVKATEILIPFVFYDGTSTPGGCCKIKKGEHIWLFLDQSRKVGAELGVGAGDRSKGGWARVGVDDLMLVRGDVIIPHHYDFYYFLVNKVKGHDGPLFDFSPEPTAATPAVLEKEVSIPKDFNPLARPGKKKEQSDSDNEKTLEGADDDPNMTKVVDRRWYEKNKHIYPASLWTEFDPTKDYSSGVRTDTQGNSFFFT